MEKSESALTPAIDNPRFPDLISQLLNDIEEERTKYLEEAVHIHYE
ncbi:hypothetical protein D917_07458 [Trichinella nativa]|uniref:Uncharacterized protein n=1 Tax=Trichinella nativa TaxID=6335 RepID=A0A1Y3ENQ4_9BILA|nr:hypothetical protein D917_07458 [Trichinella nativa]